jgi:hypothetical protein
MESASDTLLDRPKSPKVFGILSIVFASIVLLFSLFAFLGSFAGANMKDVIAASGGMRGVDEAMVSVLADLIGDIYTGAAINSGLFVVFSALLLAIGIGQVGYRRWARSWSVYWGIGALVSLVVMSIVLFAMVAPVYDRIFEAAGAMADDPQIRRMMAAADMGPIAGAGGTVFLILFFSPYPILLLSFFTKARLKEAMVR